MNRICSRTLFQTVFSSANVGQGTLPWTHYHQCWYSTKRRNAAVDRWDAESTLLFGSKQKKRTVKKGAGVSTVKAVKKTEEQSDKAVTNSVPRAERDVEVDSTGWWNEEGRNLKEQTNLHQTGRTGRNKDHLSARWSAQKNKSYLNIPKIMPIPGSKEPSESDSRYSASTPKTYHGPSLASAGDRTDGSAASEPKRTDFVLQCPLFPSQSEEIRSQAAEFHSLVDSCGLRYLPTVNTVLNKTRSDLSSFFLQRWREKMIQELGEDGFRKHQEATIWQGTTLHACIQQYLSGVSVPDIQVQENIRGHWDSISSILPGVTEVQALETSVSHPWLCYKGTFDCIAKYENVLYVIDWKTSSKPKPLLSNLFDNPLQVAAYLGAVNFSAEFTSKFGVIHHAAIVVAYSNGEAAHIHKIQPALCQHYWNQWCQRLHQYWTMISAEKAC